MKADISVTSYVTNKHKVIKDLYNKELTYQATVPSFSRSSVV